MRYEGRPDLVFLRPTVLCIELIHRLKTNCETFLAMIRSRDVGIL